MQNNLWRPWALAWLTGALLTVLHGAVLSAHGGEPAAESMIYGELRFRLAEDAPDERLLGELSSMASYFSHYPEVVEIFRSLRGEAWSIRHSPGRHSTQVRGSRLAIEQLVVHFDAQSAGQVKFQAACDQKPEHCRVSPADLFLHELLHVQQILKSAPGRWLHPALYPLAHEGRVLRREASIYRAMSARDSKPRPLRVEHQGRAVTVSCVTCTR